MKLLLPPGATVEYYRGVMKVDCFSRYMESIDKSIDMSMSEHKA